MLNLFTDNWMDPPILNEGEKMIRIMTSNDMNILYAIVDETMTAEEIDEEASFALRKGYGKSLHYLGYADESFICEAWMDALKSADEAWDGEGYYRIGLSSGGQWSNEGPAWYSELTRLARAIDSASIDDVTLGYAEKVRQFQEYELDALLGDRKEDFDVEGIIAYATKPCSDGNRYWTVDEDELAENLPYYDMTLDE